MAMAPSAGIVELGLAPLAHGDVGRHRPVPLGVGALGDSEVLGA